MTSETLSVGMMVGMERVMQAEAVDGEKGSLEVEGLHQLRARIGVRNIHRRMETEWVMGTEWSHVTKVTPQDL